MLYETTYTDERVTRFRWRQTRLIVRLLVCFNPDAHEHLRGLPLRPRRDRKAHNELQRSLQAGKAESLRPCSEACDDGSAARSDNPAVNRSVAVLHLRSFRVARFYSTQRR